MDKSNPPETWTPERVAQFIRQVAEERGVSPDFAVRVAELESSLRPGIRNKSANRRQKGTSAHGVYQLTDDRRLELGLDPIKSRGLPVEDEIRYGIESLVRNRDYLKRRLSRDPEHFEVYAAHFSGPQGSYKVLSASPETPLAKILSRKAMAANPQLKNLTAGQARELWQQRLGSIPAAQAQPRPPRLTPQQIEQHVPDPARDLPIPGWDLIDKGQLYAQQDQQDQPVMMADGGMALPPIPDPSSPVTMYADGGNVGDIGEQLTGLIEGASSDEDFDNINSLIAAHYPRQRADGSPPEGETLDEPTPEELAAASKPSFRASAAGGRRKKGNISKALESGTAAREMLKGMTMLPQNLLGAPVDLATLAMRPMGYDVEKPVMGSDWLKEKSRRAGVAYAPSGTSAEQGFFTAGDLLSNLVNPAGATRSAVRGAEKTGEAAKMLARDFQAYNQALGPAGASYAVRPSGSVMATEEIGGKPSGVSRIVNEGQSSSRDILPELYPNSRRTPEGEFRFIHADDPSRTISEQEYAQKEQILEDFWEKKAKNYFVKQYGTPDDPIAKAIAAKKIKSSVLEEAFPDYMLDPLSLGKTKTSPITGESQFFPKYPRAWEDFTKRYDKATGLAGDVVLRGPGMEHPQYNWSASPQAQQIMEQAAALEADKMLAQGARPNMINPALGSVFRLESDPSKMLAGDGTYRAKLMLEEFEKGNLSPTLRTAIERGEPVYDFTRQYTQAQAPLDKIFEPEAINRYLASIPVREASKMRFEDVIANSLQMNETRLGLQAIAGRIKEGKTVPESVFSQGLSQPLVAFPEGNPFQGFTWRKIEDRKATVPEGAYIGHSVGGYELGGITYGPAKRKGFLTDDYQVYTLRDPRNRPVTTIEAYKDSNGNLSILQVKGDGRATGNTAPEKHGDAVLFFLHEYLKPTSISESDTYLTPALQQYKRYLRDPASIGPPAPAANPAAVLPQGGDPGVEGRLNDLERVLFPAGGGPGQQPVLPPVNANPLLDPAAVPPQDPNRMQQAFDDAYEQALRLFRIR